MSTHTTTTAPRPTTSERGELHPCACSFVHVEGEDVRCGRTTRRVFAPGHDAQLKSRLIQAGFRGLAVRRLLADGTPELSSVAEAAGEHGFGYQVAAGIVRLQRLANEKTARREAREADREARRAVRTAARELADLAKADKPAPRAPRTQREQVAERDAKPQVAKIGRWPYPGTVVADGSFAYVTKNGQAKVAKPGSYTLTDAS